MIRNTLAILNNPGSWGSLFKNRLGQNPGPGDPANQGGRRTTSVVAFILCLGRQAQQSARPPQAAVTLKIGQPISRFLKRDPHDPTFLIFKELLLQ